MKPSNLKTVKFGFSLLILSIAFPVIKIEYKRRLINRYHPDSQSIHILIALLLLSSQLIARKYFHK